MHEICRVDENYGIFSDWSEGGKYLVLVGKGNLHDIPSWEIDSIKKQLEPAEREKLENYLQG